MSQIGGIIKKEVKELLTPSTLIPLIIFALIFALMGNVFKGADESIGDKPTIGLISFDDDELAIIVEDTLNENATIVYNGTSIDDGIEISKQENALALIVIPSNFTENIMNNKSGILEIYWLMKGAGLTDMMPLGAVDALVSSAKYEISRTLIGDESNIDPKIVLNPTSTYDTAIFKGKTLPGLSPGIITSQFMGSMFVVPLIVVMVIIMAGSMVISSMGMEKENKTLETLLTLPIKRGTIVFGKLVGAAIVGLIAAIIYMLGLGYYMTSFSYSGPVDLSVYGLSLDMTDYVLVGISLFLSLLSALAICMILGIFTKNFKAAQTMTLPVVLLALIPMFITMASDFSTLPLPGQIVIFAIPFSHPMLAIRELMFDNTGIVIAGILYQLIFMTAAMTIAITLFKRDILLTGRSKGMEKKRRFPIIAFLQRGRKS